MVRVHGMLYSFVSEPVNFLLEWVAAYMWIQCPWSFLFYFASRPWCRSRTARKNMLGVAHPTVVLAAGIGTFNFMSTDRGHVCGLGPVCVPPSHAETRYGW